MADGDRAKSRSQRTDLGSARSMVDRQRAGTSLRRNLRPSAFNRVSARRIGCEAHTPGRLHRPPIHRTHETDAPTGSMCEIVSLTHQPTLRFGQTGVSEVRLHDDTRLRANRYIIALSYQNLLQLLPERLLTRYAYFAQITELKSLSEVVIQLTCPTMKPTASSAPPPRPTIPPAHQHIARVRRDRISTVCRWKHAHRVEQRSVGRCCADRDVRVVLRNGQGGYDRSISLSREPRGPVAGTGCRAVAAASTESHPEFVRHWGMDRHRMACQSGERARQRPSLCGARRRPPRLTLS